MKSMKGRTCSAKRMLPADETCKKKRTRQRPGRDRVPTSRESKLSPYFAKSSGSPHLVQHQGQSKNSSDPLKSRETQSPEDASPACVQAADENGSVKFSPDAAANSDNNGHDKLKKATSAVDVIPADYILVSLQMQPLPPGFSLAQSICSYGYFFLAPNTWIPAPDGMDENDGVFCRPLELPHTDLIEGCHENKIAVKSKFFPVDGQSSDKPDAGPLPGVPLRSRQQQWHGESEQATEGEKAPEEEAVLDSSVAYVVLSQPGDRTQLRVEIYSLEQKLTPQQKEVVNLAVQRILRLDQDLDAWFEKHPKAAARGFGRTYRSPTLFEDMVKTITNCNIHFSRTIAMNKLLCRHFGSCGIAFPSPERLSRASEEELRSLATVGYRADRILRLAKQFASGELCQSWFEDPAVPTVQVQQQLMALYGFGKFAASNVLQLLGRYDGTIEAWDTETVRLMRELGYSKGKSGDLHKIARQRYEPFAPYQFLAYWFELWLNYEQSVGCVSPRWTLEMFSKAM